MVGDQNKASIGHGNIEVRLRACLLRQHRRLLVVQLGQQAPRPVACAGAALAAVLTSAVLVAVAVLHVAATGGVHVVLLAPQLLAPSQLLRDRLLQPRGVFLLLEGVSGGGKRELIKAGAHKL